MWMFGEWYGSFPTLELLGTQWFVTWRVERVYGSWYGTLLLWYCNFQVLYGVLHGWSGKVWQLVCWLTLLIVLYLSSTLCYVTWRVGEGFGGISDATLACGDDAAGRRSCFAHNALILLQQCGGSVVQDEETSSKIYHVHKVEMNAVTFHSG